MFVAIVQPQRSEYPLPLFQRSVATPREDRHGTMGRETPTFCARASVKAHKEIELYKHSTTRERALKRTSTDLIWRGSIVFWQLRHPEMGERRSPRVFSFFFFSLSIATDRGILSRSSSPGTSMARLQLACVSSPFSVLENREEPRSLSFRAEGQRTDVKSRQLGCLACVSART